MLSNEDNVLEENVLEAIVELQPTSLIFPGVAVYRFLLDPGAVTRGSKAL